MLRAKMPTKCKRHSRVRDLSHKDHIDDHKNVTRWSMMRRNGIRIIRIKGTVKIAKSAGTSSIKKDEWNLNKRMNEKMFQELLSTSTRKKMLKTNKNPTQTARATSTTCRCICRELFLSLSRSQWNSRCLIVVAET